MKWAQPLLYLYYFKLAIRDSSFAKVFLKLVLTDHTTLDYGCCLSVLRAREQVRYIHFNNLLRSNLRILAGC